MSDSILLLESIKRTAQGRLNSAAPDLLDQEMRWVLDDFLKASRLWRRHVAVPLTVGTIDYTLDIEDYESVAGLVVAKFNTSTLAVYIQHTPYTETGTPARIGMLTDRTVRVYPVPASGVAGQLDLDVWLTMLPSTDQPPPDEIRPFHTALLHGLLARCYSIPDRPWTNMAMASYHEQHFIHETAQARRTVDGARARGAQFMPIPRF